MSSNKRLKLLPFKVTQRSTAGKTVHRLIPRGSVMASSDLHETTEESSPQLELDSFWSTSYFENHEIPAQPSLHKIAQEASVASWNKVLPMILRAVIESSAMPLDKNFCSCMYAMWTDGKECFISGNSRCIQKKFGWYVRPNEHNTILTTCLL